MEEYAGRILAERYRLPLPPPDAPHEYELIETRAFDTRSGQEVLVRQVPLPEVVDAEMLDGHRAPAAGRRPVSELPAVRRAIAAAQAAARVPDHPRLDQVFDVFAEGNSLWIVSELVPARSLAALIADEPLSPYRAAEVAADVLTALRVLHAHGWTHRNITVRTVLVCDDGRVVLTGLAAGAAEEALCGYDPVPVADPAEPPGDPGGEGARQDAAWARGVPAALPRPPGAVVREAQPYESPYGGSEFGGPDLGNPSFGGHGLGHGLGDRDPFGAPDLPGEGELGGYAGSAGSVEDDGYDGYDGDGYEGEGYDGDGHDDGSGGHGGPGLGRFASEEPGPRPETGPDAGREPGADDTADPGGEPPYDYAPLVAPGYDTEPLAGPLPGPRVGPTYTDHITPEATADRPDLKAAARAGAIAAYRAGAQAAARVTEERRGGAAPAEENRPAGSNLPQGYSYPYGGPGTAAWHGATPRRTPTPLPKALPPAQDEPPSPPPQTWLPHSEAAHPPPGARPLGPEPRPDEAPSPDQGRAAAPDAPDQAWAAARDEGWAGGPASSRAGGPAVGPQPRPDEDPGPEQGWGPTPDQGWAAAPDVSSSPEQTWAPGSPPGSSAPRAEAAPDPIRVPDTSPGQPPLPDGGWTPSPEPDPAADRAWAHGPGSDAAADREWTAAPGSDASPSPDRTWPVGPEPAPAPDRTWAPGPGSDVSPSPDGTWVAGPGPRPDGDSDRGWTPLPAQTRGGEPGADVTPAAQAHAPGPDQGRGGYAPGPDRAHDPQAPAPDQRRGAQGPAHAPAPAQGRPGRLALPQGFREAEVAAVHAGPGAAVPRGWAAVAAGPVTALDAERARLTRMAVVGAVTERWAPEQAGPVHDNWQLAAPIGPATDLWALGALLYRAVQGHAPYPEDSAAELVEMVCAEPPAFAEECGPLRPIVESLLRQDPTERPDFEELRGWLRSLVRSAPEPDGGTGIGGFAFPLPEADPARLPAVRRRGDLSHGRHRGTQQAAKRPRGGRSLGRTLLLLVLVALAGGVAYAMFFLPEATPGDGDGAQARGSGKPSASATVPGSGGANTPTGTPQSKPAPQSGSPSAPPPANVPAGYTAEQDPEGFQVFVPSGWERHGVNDMGQVRYTNGDFVLILTPGRDAVDGNPDPLGYQRDKERELEPFRTSTWATSTGVKQTRVGQQLMAEGQYTWTDGGGRSVYVRNRALALGGRYHVVMVIGPQDAQDKVTEVFDKATGSYRPGS
ncbi:protein kinase [Streptomyces sp. NPDC002138]|uniref:protein kinase n=1 Tax=Streptomyces sp. NPDC002138 TaxID=3154410 RepID=UPI00332A16A1